MSTRSDCPSTTTVAPSLAAAHGNGRRLRLKDYTLKTVTKAQNTWPNAIHPGIDGLWAAAAANPHGATMTKSKVKAVISTALP